jgi:hypothetical protein
MRYIKYCERKLLKKYTNCVCFSTILIKIKEFENDIRIAYEI